jgi:hypothetical protein
MSTGPKEAFYDERISHLMKDIIALSDEAGINMFATFALDDDKENEGNIIRCTTCIPADKSDEEGHALVKSLLRVTQDNYVVSPRYSSCAFMITHEANRGTK